MRGYPAVDCVYHNCSHTINYRKIHFGIIHLYLAQAG